MSKKNKKNRVGVVFSTNSDFDYNYEKDNEEMEEISPGQQKLRIFLDKKKRRGKEVTLIAGFRGSDDDLKELGKFLKTKCGVGGAVKDGEIMIQGNHRDKVVQLLIEKGYTNSKKSGG